MKVLIEIDEKFYQWVKMCGIMPFITQGKVIPDNATNGDVIMAMFSNLEIEYTDIDEYTNKPRYVKLIVGDTIITRMSADRWNAPYKEEHDANDS